MDWQTIVGIGIVLGIIAAALQIFDHVFGLRDRWKTWRNPAAAAAIDQTHLKARIRLATGPGTGFKFTRSLHNNSFGIRLRNEGQHPAYDVRPVVTFGGWTSESHANGITIPPHEPRTFSFHFPYLIIRTDRSNNFELTAPYRDGTGEHVFTMRFQVIHDPHAEWPGMKPVVESES